MPEILPTRVVNCRYTKSYDVYIGRPAKWGNPFVIGRDGDRRAVIAKYFDWIKTQPALLAALPELRGKVLGCWCVPEECHGQLIAYMADQPEIDFRVYLQFPVTFFKPIT